MPPSVWASRIRCSLGRSLLGVDVRHPDPAAAGAAAERVRSVAGHLDELGAGRLDQLARRLGDPVVARQVAGVVVGDAGAGQWRAQRDHAPAPTSSASSSV